MPKVKLIFSLPEEREEFEMTQNAGSYCCVLTDLDNWLRSKIKYEDIENVSVNEVRKKLHEFLEDHNIRI